jgi:hypothetical protein
MTVEVLYFDKKEQSLNYGLKSLTPYKFPQLPVSFYRRVRQYVFSLQSAFLSDNIRLHCIT